MSVSTPVTNLQLNTSPAAPDEQYAQVILQRDHYEQEFERTGSEAAYQMYHELRREANRLLNERQAAAFLVKYSRGG